ncbi:MAG: PQQ-binding-like beta-propeller repeat protein, partial [Bryobacteraceae bacterium]
MKLVAVALAIAAALPAQVTYDRIVNALKEQHNWVTYWGDYSAVRHRDLKQIHTGNVKDLRVDWIFQTGQSGANQNVPLVVDGVMYATAPNGFAFALDARTGRQLWMYKHAFPPGEKPAGLPNRGLAILGERLFMTTPDAHVVALDARNGRLLWETEMAGYAKGQYTAT